MVSGWLSGFFSPKGVILLQLLLILSYGLLSTARRLAGVGSHVQ